jgi:hypothetical protein
MTSILTSWVWHRSPEDLTAAEMIVALALAESANDEFGFTFPTVHRLAKMTRVTERTVRRALVSLTDRGVIQKVTDHTARKPAMYRFTVRNAPEWTPYILMNNSAEAKIVRAAMSKEAEDDAQGGHSDSPPVRTAGHSGIPSRARQGVPSTDGTKEKTTDDAASEGGAAMEHPSALRSLVGSNAPNQQAGIDWQAAPTTGDAPPSPPTGREIDLAYWRDHDAARAKLFHACLDEYPKRDHIDDAMGQWRETIGTTMDGQPDALQVIWSGIQVWKQYWEREQTESKFIPSFRNWLRAERWKERPR